MLLLLSFKDKLCIMSGLLVKNITGDCMFYSSNLQENIKFFNDRLKIADNFNIIRREIVICNVNACLIYLDGMIKDDIMEKVMEFFYSIDDSNFMSDADTFSKNCIPYVEVSISDDIDGICTHILSGMLFLMIDKFSKGILLDVREYPQRTTVEPDDDKVLRGSRDGFVETLIVNTALIRKRIRNHNYVNKLFQIGDVSKTDVSLCYMDNLVDKKLLDTLSYKLRNAKVNSLTMNQQSLIESIYKYNPLNPFPKVKYTERPDSAVSAILDGNIVILVDNSPQAIVLPTSIFDIMEEADDYYFPPVIGSYLKLSRYLISFLALFITPLWLLFINNPQTVPECLKFTLSISESNIPIIWQLLILEFSIDGIRLAALNTPSNLTTPLSVIIGIVLSEFSINSGWFSSEVMLYMAFVTLANYGQPSMELGYSFKLLRIILLILTSIFNIIGFILGTLLIAFMLLMNKTISGKSYLYPLIPFNKKKFLNTILRIRQNQ